MSIRRNLAFAFGGNFGFFVIQFAASLVVARLLSPSEMGVYAASMAMVYILNGVLNVGLMSYVVREKEMPPEKLGTVLALTLAQSAIMAGGLYVAASLVGLLARDARVTESLRILCISAAMLPMIATFQGVRQRRMDFGLSSLVTIVNVSVAAAATIGLAYAGFSYRAQPWANNLGNVVAVVMALIVQRRELKVRLSFAYWRAIMKYGTSIVGASMILNITNRLPDVLLTRAAGAPATGLYNRGAGLIDIFNNAIVRSVQRVLASQMAADRRAGHGIGGVYGRMTRTMTGLLWPFFAIVAVLSGPIINLLYGPRWLPAAPVLSIIAVAAALNAAVVSRAEVLISVGRERQLPRNEAIRGSIGVALFWAGAHFGLIWAALTRIVDSLIAILLYSPGIHAATGLSWGEMGRAYLRSSAVALAAAAPAVIAMQMAGWPNTLPLIELAALLLAGGVAWLAALFVFRHELGGEVARFARMARARFAPQA